MEQVRKSFDDKINDTKRINNLKAIHMLKYIKNDTKNDDPSVCLNAKRLQEKSYLIIVCKIFMEKLVMKNVLLDVIFVISVVIILLGRILLKI